MATKTTTNAIETQAITRPVMPCVVGIPVLRHDLLAPMALLAPTAG